MPKKNKPKKNFIKTAKHRHKWQFVGKRTLAFDGLKYLGTPHLVFVCECGMQKLVKAKEGT